MRITSIGNERRFISQMLHFVNVRAITTRQQVVQMFEGLMYVRSDDPLAVAAPPFLDAGGIASYR